MHFDCALGLEGSANQAYVDSPTDRAAPRSQSVLALCGDHADGEAGKTVRVRSNGCISVGGILMVSRALKAPSGNGAFARILQGRLGLRAVLPRAFAADGEVVQAKSLAGAGAHRVRIV